MSRGTVKLMATSTDTKLHCMLVEVFNITACARAARASPQPYMPERHNALRRPCHDPRGGADKDIARLARTLSRHKHELSRAARPSRRPLEMPIARLRTDILPSDSCGNTLVAYATTPGHSKLHRAASTWLGAQTSRANAMKGAPQGCHCTLGCGCGAADTCATTSAALGEVARRHGTMECVRDARRIQHGAERSLREPQQVSNSPKSSPFHPPCTLECAIWSSNTVPKREVCKRVLCIATALDRCPDVSRVNGARCPPTIFLVPVKPRAQH